MFKTTFVFQMRARASRDLVYDVIDKELSEDFYFSTQSAGSIESTNNPTTIRSWIRNRQLRFVQAPPAPLTQEHDERKDIMIVYNRLRAQSLNSKDFCYFSSLVV